MFSALILQLPLRIKKSLNIKKMISNDGQFRAACFYHQAYQETRTKTSLAGYDQLLSILALR
ncbi:MAG: hypothetical protein CSB48_01640 [Proteobacteria bacterium]|nr:MAG: hypothetical protein CSB48_01640 [Pseudomonadota bacterium]PIE40241.1 MAG: hypothetical protein CSA51_01815 [Gammaproteobacteria bacterium]